MSSSRNPLAGAARGANVAVAPASRRRAAADRAVAVAVYHTSNQVDRDLAALRQTGRFALEYFPKDATLAAGAEGRFDAVLWELSRAHQPDRKRVLAMSRRVPVVSYSRESHPELAALSRAMGFAGHLTAPLSPDELADSIATAPRGGDFAMRVRQLQRTLRSRIHRREVVLDLVRATGATLEPERVAEALVDFAARTVPAPCWAVIAPDLNGEPALLADRGLAPSTGPAVFRVARWVIKHADDLAVADLSGDHRVGEGVAAAALAFPLKCRGRVVGALVGLDRAPSTEPPRLTAAVRLALAQVLEVPALALDNALLLKRAEALSVTDDLTRLYNSRYLNQVLRRESKRASRSGRPLSLLFIDLDGFKSINDSHGHLSGSKALVEAAAVIRGSARETDVVARFGGDEFAVVLPDTGSEGAVAVGDRIRERIAAHRFLADDGLQIALTASVGVATLPDVAGSAEELVKSADMAMYRVKDAGKNGIFVATEQGPG